MRGRLRLLRHTAARPAPLAQNAEHAFARHYALAIYRAGAVYSFIPKNACSTMRLSIAIANGAIASPADVNWIHTNNPTFVADLPALATADYTFVILRCPFARLASCYLDKIVSRSRSFWTLHDLTNRDIAPEDFTFRTFVSTLASRPVLFADEHWRPQVNFLVYADYDDVFDVADMPAAIARLRERIGLQVVDARRLVKKGRDGLRRIDGDGPDTSPLDLLVKRSAGEEPDPRTLYDDALVERVAKLYADDVALYRATFGADRLMFDA